jgi:membrane-bound lytic murein transglycosylase B
MKNHAQMQTWSRRGALLGMGAFVAACSAGGAGGGGAARAPNSFRWHAAPNPAFDAWVRGFSARATARGIPANVVSRAMGAARFIPEVVEKDRNQTEVKRSLEDYLAIAASDERIAQGRAALARMGGTLNAIEARYGVPAHVVAAVWGLESFYGTRMGDVPVFSALSTLAYDGRRGAFFESQLIAALKIVSAGDVAPDNMLGSWAGAMGHTQFIPTSYLAYAVDFTGDGRRDIWGGDPTDALASTAAYLAKSGWQRGQPWGEEVAAPSGLAGGRKSAADWATLGVTGANGGRLRGSGAATLLQTGGPAFLLYGNYNVILRYNNAQSYAIGVGHLSDRLAGAGPLRAGFGPDSAGMTIDQRRALQQRLAALGYDIGTPDGVIGPKTNAAISAYQAGRGLPATGQPSLALLRALGG